MDENDEMMPERILLPEDDAALEALIALIEQRVVENLARAIEQMVLERDASA